MRVISLRPNYVTFYSSKLFCLVNMAYLIANSTDPLWPHSVAFQMGLYGLHVSLHNWVKPQLGLFGSKSAFPGLQLLIVRFSQAFSAMETNFILKFLHV